VVKLSPANRTFTQGRPAVVLVQFADDPDYLVDDKRPTLRFSGLPDGFAAETVNESNGIVSAYLSGTPTQNGSGTIEVTATDVDGATVTASVPWTVEEPEPPAMPVGVFVTGASGGKALVEWDDPYPPGGTPVTGYSVRVSPGTTRTVAASARSITLTGLDNRTSYTIGVRATSARGDSLEKTLTLTPTSLPLTVKPTAITYGAAPVLSGQVIRGGAGPIAGAIVTLDQRPAGRTTWSRIGSTKTDRTGAWRSTVKPSTTTAYRVSYPGSYGMWAATSATPSATVRYAVKIKASTTRPKAKKKITINGTVRPVRAGVKVTLQRKVGSKWVTVTTVKTAKNGTYSIARAFTRGTWTLRVSAAGGSANATATSSTVTLRVK
jgi:hypothetical protein